MEHRETETPKRGSEVPKTTQQVSGRAGLGPRRERAEDDPAPAPHPAHPVTSPRSIATSEPSCLKAASPSCPVRATPWRQMEPRLCLPELGKRPEHTHQGPGGCWERRPLQTRGEASAAEARPRPTDPLCLSQPQWEMRTPWDPRVPGTAGEVPFVPTGAGGQGRRGCCWVRDRTVSKTDPASHVRCS